MENLRKIEFKTFKEIYDGDLCVTHKKTIIKTGYFHKWINESEMKYGYDDKEYQISSNYALVEDQEGNILMLEPFHIKFIKE